MRSADMHPGDRLEHESRDVIVTLRCRKTPDDDHHGLPYQPGWWLVDQGGLSDSIIDGGAWTLHATRERIAPTRDLIEQSLAWADATLRRFQRGDGYGETMCRYDADLPTNSVRSTIVTLARNLERARARAALLTAERDALHGALAELTSAASCFSQCAFVAKGKDLAACRADQFDAIQKARALLKDGSPG